MNEIVQQAAECARIGATREAIELLIEAIKLLSKGQQQVMDDIEKINGEYRGQAIK